MADPGRLFRQTITYATITGRDAYGKPTLSAQSTALARVQPRQKLIRDARGQEYQASHVVYTKAQLGLGHYLWLPGYSTADATGARRIAAVEQEVDARGVEVYRKVWV